MHVRGARIGALSPAWVRITPWEAALVDLAGSSSGRVLLNDVLPGAHGVARWSSGCV